jgi:hypothetical protein
MSTKFSVPADIGALQRRGHKPIERNASIDA